MGKPKRTVTFLFPQYLVLMSDRSYLTGKGQEDIRRDMTSKYENILGQFQNVESGRRIRRKLEDDISSVTTAINRPPSIAEQTDVNFAMRNYLNKYEQATVMDEPPPIEIM